MSKAGSKYDTAAKRWAGVGPYYAMFPSVFADRVIKRYTEEGDAILDPFAGRGTSLFSAAVRGRCGIGIEINPVGWVYAKAKLNPANKEDVLERLEQLGKNAYRFRAAPDRLPQFFDKCYTREVRQFLLGARHWLNWRRNRVDRTIMALVLVHLHGKRTDSLSNQMRQTKSMSPQYAIRWWKRHRESPPELDPVEFLRKKLDWRYAKGLPELEKSEIYLGDSVARLADVAARLPFFGVGSAKLLFTSPPYCGVTNYHYDQWIRLWLLGGPNAPTAPTDSRRGRFVHRQKYRQLLLSVFKRAAPLLDKEAVVYVRTDSRKLTLDMTLHVLQRVFPKKRMRKYRCPFPGTTQTALFGGKSAEHGEIDLVLRP